MNTTNSTNSKTVWTKGYRNIWHRVNAVDEQGGAIEKAVCGAFVRGHKVYASPQPTERGVSLLAPRCCRTCK